MSEPRYAVEVETIRIPSKTERKLQFLAQSQQDADQIARARNAKTKANRERYTYAKPK